MIMNKNNNDIKNWNVMGEEINYDVIQLNLNLGSSYILIMLVHCDNNKVPSKCWR